MKQARHEEHWTNTAQQVLGDCTCHESYTSRKLIAPDCVWHDCHLELIEALEAAYEMGRVDEAAAKAEAGTKAPE